jgi:hypothetical protein
MGNIYIKNQKRARLEREICHYTGQVLVYRERTTPQKRRAYTIALRCLKRRVEDLTRLLSGRLA